MAGFIFLWQSGGVAATYPAGAVATDKGAATLLPENEARDQVTARDQSIYTASAADAEADPAEIGDAHAASIVVGDVLVQ
jgi:hypothetical protein